MSASPEAPGRPLRRWIAGIATGAALMLIVLRFGDLEQFETLLGHARPVWMLAALALQAATYVGLAQGWRAVLSRAGARQPLRRLIPIALTKLFADQVMPSAGIGGNVLLVDRLIAIGVPRGAAAATLLASMIGFYAAYAALALAMLFVLAFHHKASALPIALVSALLLVAIAIPAAALWLRRRGRRPLSPRLQRIAPLRSMLRVVGEAPAFLIRDWRLLAELVGWSGSIFLADAATLAACLWSLGAPATLDAAFVALMAASIVVTLGPIPMGLGTFEASATAALHMLGVPSVAALAGVLLFRGLTLWLPLLPGLVLMRLRPRRGRGAAPKDNE